MKSLLKLVPFLSVACKPQLFFILFSPRCMTSCLTQRCRLRLFSVLTQIDETLLYQARRKMEELDKTTTLLWTCMLPISASIPKTVSMPLYMCQPWVWTMTSNILSQCAPHVIAFCMPWLYLPKDLCISESMDVEPPHSLMCLDLRQHLCPSFCR